MFYRPFESHDAPVLVTVVAYDDTKAVAPYTIRLEDGREIVASERELGVIDA